LHKLLPEERKKDTLIVAVAPDSVERIGDIVEKVRGKTNQPFAITLLSDADHKVIDRYGLLNETAVEQGRFLPHPTTFLVDSKGIVRWRFTEKNYRIRPTNEMILKELEKMATP